jgi:hypothetical protein
MKQLVSLSVHLMEPSASQLNSSFKRLDLWRNDTIKDGVWLVFRHRSAAGYQPIMGWQKQQLAEKIRVFTSHAFFVLFLSISNSYKYSMLQNCSYLTKLRLFSILNTLNEIVNVSKKPQLVETSIKNI